MPDNEFIVNIIKKCDQRLYEHCYRTAELSYRVGKILNVNCELLFDAAMVHDIGKVATSRELLTAPRKLTAYEKKIIDMHSYLGYCMLINFGVQKDICEIVLHHHGTEKCMFDYTKRTTEENLQLATILRCIDAYDALTSDRVYSAALPSAKALELLKTQNFDIKTIQVIEKLVEETYTGNVS